MNKGLGFGFIVLYLSVDEIFAFSLDNLPSMLM